MTHGVIKRYWPEIREAIDAYSAKHSFIMRFVKLPDTPDGLANMLLKHLQEPVTDAYIAFAEGNEGGSDNRQTIDNLIKGVDQLVNQTIRGIIKPLAKIVLRLRIFKTFRLVLQSILEDRNDIGTSHEAVINDHTAIINL